MIDFTKKKKTLEVLFSYIQKHSNNFFTYVWKFPLTYLFKRILFYFIYALLFYYYYFFYFTSILYFYSKDKYFIQ